MGKWLLKLLRLLGWFPLFLLGLVGAGLVFIHLPFVQDFARDKIEDFLEEKFGTEVEIGKLRASLAGSVLLEGVYLEDEQGDTLVYGEELRLEIDLMSLFRNRLRVRNAELEGWKGYLSRAEGDSLFNFGFIGEAFGGEKAETSDGQISLGVDARREGRKSVDQTSPKGRTKPGGVLGDSLKGGQFEGRGGEEKALAEEGGNLEAFERGKVEEQDSAGGGLEIIVDRVRLDRSRFVMVDSLTGKKYDGEVGSLKTEFDRFDLDSLIFITPLLTFEGVCFEMEVWKAGKTEKQKQEKREKRLEKPGGGKWPYLGIGHFAVKDARFKMTNHYGGMKVEAGIPVGNFGFLPIDSLSRPLVITYAFMQKPFCFITDWETGNPAIKEPAPYKEYSPEGLLRMFPDVNLVVQNFEMTDGSFRRDDRRLPVDHSQFQAGHLNLEGIHSRIPYFKVGPYAMNSKVSSFSCKLGRGVRLKEFSSLFHYSSERFELDDIRIATQKSGLEGLMRLNGKPASAEGPGEALQRGQNDIAISKGSFALKELSWFAPALDSVLNTGSGHSIQLNVTVDGNLDSLNIQRLGLEAGDRNQVQAHGVLSLKEALPDGELFVDHMYTDQAALGGLLAEGMLPGSLNLGDSLSGKGYVLHKGAVSRFELDLFGGLGTCRAGLHLFPPLASNGNTFQGEIDLIDFNLGKLLRQPDTVLGTVSLQAEADGEELQVDSLEGRLHFRILEAGYNQYTYRNLQGAGHIWPGLLELEAEMLDSALSFHIGGGASWADSSSDMHLQADFRHADPAMLGLVDLPVKWAGQFALEAGTAGADSFEIDFHTQDFNFKYDDVDYPLNIDKLAVKVLGPQSRLELKSNMLDAVVNAEASPDQLAGTVQYPFLKHLSWIADVEDSARGFDFNLLLKESGLLTSVLLPELEYLGELPIIGHYLPEEDQLDLDLRMPRAVYAGLNIDSTHLAIHSDSVRLEYALEIGQVYDSTYSVSNPALTGSVKDKQLYLQINQRENGESVNRYLVGGKVLRRDSQVVLQMIPGQLVLDYVPWEVDSANFLAFGGDEVEAHRLFLQAGQQRIRLETTSKGLLESDLNLSLENLPAQLISKLVFGESETIKGRINGNAKLKGFPKRLDLESQIAIESLEILDDPLGDLDIRLVRPEDGQIRAWTSLGGPKGGFLVNALYIPEDRPDQLEVRARFDELDLKALSNLLDGSLSRMGGKLKGRLRLTGRTDSLSAEGGIDLVDGGFLIDLLNTYYSLDSARFDFRPGVIALEHFEMEDSLGNEASITGEVRSAKFMNFDLDVNFNMKDLLVLNTTEEDNPDYYGTVIADADVKIRGRPTDPILEAATRLKKGTTFTYVIPSSSTSFVSAEGVVEFVETREIFQADTVQLADSLLKELGGLDLAVAIEVDRETSLRVITDPASGDRLDLLGGGNLSLTITPGGTMNLVGKYDVEAGKYRLRLYKILNRELDIAKGSFLSWSGNPLDPELNIRAFDQVNTSPAPLFPDVATMPPQQQQVYYQAMPFQVFVELAGALSQIDLSFDIDLSEDARGELEGLVRNKLEAMSEDPSEINKQAFSLLVFGGFIQEDVFAEVSVESYLGFNRFISEQLNQFAEKNIKVVDMNFDLQSYDDYGSDNAAFVRTDLSLLISKSFFKDRLEVKAGGTVNLQADEREQEQLERRTIPDLMLEYRLSRDGRYRVRVFQESDYTGVINGRLIERGVALQFDKEFDRLVELFQRNREYDLKKDEELEGKQKRKDGKEKEEGEEKKKKGAGKKKEKGKQEELGGQIEEESDGREKHELEGDGDKKKPNREGDVNEEEPKDEGGDP